MARFISTRLTAAPVGDANGFLTSVDMSNGAYALDANTPTSGARHVTVTRTAGGDLDVGGTVALVGKDLSGQVISETITVGASTIVVASTLWFSYLTSATSAGWTIDVGGPTADTIEIGWGAECAVATGSGTLKALFIAVTHASTITFTDATGTLLVLPNSFAVGHYEMELGYSGFLQIAIGGTQDVVAIHSPSHA